MGDDSDYEGGQWIGGEFYYEKEKKKRKFTKEDAIYGQWAVHSSSDEEYDAGRKGGRREKNYTAPVPFVSTTVMGSDSSSNKVGDEVDSGAEAKKKKKKKKSTDNGNKKEKEQAQLPTKFGASKQKKRSDGPPKKSFEEETYGSGTKPAFETFTKGIGSKLMAKMGWSGAGLGREEQGRAAPIEVIQRPKNLGLGAGGFSERTDQQSMGDLAGESSNEGEEETSEEEEEARWKKGATGRRKLKTVYDVINETEDMKPQLVVDMRGPQVRTVTDVGSALREGADKKAKGGPMPELRYNMRLLVDMSELNIQNVDRNIRATKANVIQLSHEKDRLQKQVKSEETQISTMKDLLDILTTCQEKVAAKEITLESMIRVFDLLQHKFREEYVMYKIKYLALELVTPLLKARAVGWNPLVAPSLLVPLFESWRNVLTNDLPTDFSDRNSDVDVYLQISYDAVMPPIRTALSNLWHPRNYDPVINLLNAWMGVMPQVMVDDIIEHLVMPKLQREVEAWNPRGDTVPIHAWLHPWLPLLSHRMEPLYPFIRQKLGFVLQAWHPADPSAHAILYPWKDVWEIKDMEAFLVRSILPQLIIALRQFGVSPSQQTVEPFQWVMLWEDLIPQHHFVALFESEFFPKWLHALFNWLSNGPDYEEVSRWYLGWKKMFPPDLLANDRIRTQFNIALESMNKAVTGVIPGLQAPPLPTYYAPPQQPSQPPPRDIGTDDLSLRQMVETLAVQQNLEFLPTRRRHTNGQAIYTFGSLSIYLDKGMVFVQEDGAWKAVTSEGLISKTRNKRK